MNRRLVYAPGTLMHRRMRIVLWTERKLNEEVISQHNAKRQNY